MYLFYTGGKLYPLEVEGTAPGFKWRGEYIPLVSTDFRRASKLRVRTSKGDFALLSGMFPNISEFIVKIYYVGDDMIVFERADGSVAGTINLA